jgi:hypothetical protein
MPEKHAAKPYLFLGLLNLWQRHSFEKNRQALKEEDLILRQRAELREQQELEATHGYWVPGQKQVRLGAPGERKGTATVSTLMARRMPGTVQQRLQLRKEELDLNKRAALRTEQEWKLKLATLNRANQPMRAGDLLKFKSAIAKKDEIYGTNFTKHFKPVINYATDLISQKEGARPGEPTGVNRYDFYRGIQQILSIPTYKKKLIENIEKEITGYQDRNPGASPEKYAELTNLLNDVNDGTLLDRVMPNAANANDIFQEEEEIERMKVEGQGRAMKSWVTPNGEILNLPNNQAPPEGSVPYSTGMELEVGAEGGVSLRTGVRGGKEGVTLSTQTKLQQGILDTSAGIQRLEQVAQSYRPEFLRLATKWKSFTTKWKEKLQGTGIERWANLGVPQQDRKLLADYSAFKRDAIDNINRYIKEITGAQMSEREADRLRKAAPDPGEGFFDGDAPTEFISKWKSSMKALKLSQARFMYLTQNGMTPQSIKAMAGNDTLPSLDKIKTIIERRDMEIEREIKQTNPNISKDVLDKAVSQRLKEEFGL